ncbi:MAG: protease pro-enzyme activation domain-containing protein [Capsulimonadaceae bacterium]
MSRTSLFPTPGRNRVLGVGAATAAMATLFGLVLLSHQAAHADAALISASTNVGPTPASRPITLSLVLPLRNRALLKTLIDKLYNPSDPMYGHYLTPDQFAEQFGPAPSDVAAVETAASALGLTVVDVTPNNAIIHVQAPASTVDSAFGIVLTDYIGPDGARFTAPDRSPAIPSGLAGSLVSVVGLDGSLKMHRASHVTWQPGSMRGAGTHESPLLNTALAAAGTSATPDTVKYYTEFGLWPKDVYSIYDWSNLSTASGQNVALVELDGWTTADISSWESQVLKTSTLTPSLVSVDNGTQTVEGALSSMECTLDIDMVLLMAPGLSHLYVYVAPLDGDESQEALDIYTKIATDDKASVISSSWGFNEDQVFPDDVGYANSVEQEFQQMATQGQTFCVAAGDSGAYADETLDTPNVAFEAATPYVLSVGGTDLTDGPGETWVSETSWADPGDTSRGPLGTGGGGGISSHWTIPSYQVGAFSSSVNKQGSQTMRNLPDVSLFADADDAGYVIIWTDVLGDYGPKGEVYTATPNGTSAAAPLWAGFLADVNAGRAAASRTGIGFADPTIYSLAERPTTYANDFHDIDDGSNNLYYIAVAGYDNSTGWGSFQANNLYNDLVNFSAITVKSLSFNPATLAPSASTTGTVTLSAAPTSAVTVEINNSSNTSVASVSINSGSATGTFTLTAPSSPGSYTYTASYEGSTAQQTLNVVAPGAGETTRVLWWSTGGLLSLWNYDPATGGYSQNSYGPFATWTARAIADGPDGLTRVLWVSTSGAAAIWSVNDTTGAYTQYTFGPYPGWSAQALSVAESNTTHVLWASSSGGASVWNYNTGTGVFTDDTLGPYAGWSATAIADGPDGLTRLLWNDVSGAASIWSLNTTTGVFTQNGFGPFANWSATGLSVAANNNATHVLWTDASTGGASLWNYSTSTGDFTQESYGPFPTWSATGIADNPDGNVQLLWTSTSGAASIWDLDNITGTYTQNSFGPFKGWAADAVTSYP